MNCRRARRLLAVPGAARERRDVRRHLASCPACEDLAARWAAIEQALAETAPATPAPAGFSRRVAAGLPPAEDLVGWAARRVLPATLVLVLLLSWLNLRAAEDAAVGADDPAATILGWVLDPSPAAEDGS